jgi:hypothetical protein
LDSTNTTVSGLTTSLAAKANKANETHTGTTTFTNIVVSGTTSFADGSIAQAEVAGLPALVTSLATVGNVVRLIGDVPRRVGGVIGGALLPAAPGTCVDWVTVGLTGFPAAFDFNGDTLQNAEV